MSPAVASLLALDVRFEQDPDGTFRARVEGAVAPGGAPPARTPATTAPSGAPLSRP